MSDPTVRDRLVEVRQAVESLLGSNNSTITDLLDVLNQSWELQGQSRDKIDELLQLLRGYFTVFPVDIQYPLLDTYAKLTDQRLRDLLQKSEQIRAASQQGADRAASAVTELVAVKTGITKVNDKLFLMDNTINEIAASLQGLSDITAAINAVGDTAITISTQLAAIANTATNNNVLLQRLVSCCEAGNGVTYTQPACVTLGSVRFNTRGFVGSFVLPVFGPKDVYSASYTPNAGVQGWYVDTKTDDGRQKWVNRTQGSATAFLGVAKEYGQSGAIVVYSTTAYQGSPPPQWQAFASLLFNEASPGAEGACIQVLVFNTDNTAAVTSGDRWLEVFLLVEPGDTPPDPSGIWLSYPSDFAPA